MSGTRCGVDSPCCPENGSGEKRKEKIYDNKTGKDEGGRRTRRRGFPFRLTYGYCTSNIFKAFASAPTSSCILKSNISLFDAVGLSMM
jgi:hypothetical protein